VATQECSVCGADTGEDGTTPCPCVLTAADEVDAIFDALRPPQLPTPETPQQAPKHPTTPNTTTAAAESGAAGEQGGPEVWARLPRPGKRAALGMVAAVTIGTVAFTVAASSHQDSTQAGNRIPATKPTGPDHLTPDSMDDPIKPPPAEPHTPGSAQPTMPNDPSQMGPDGGEDDTPSAPSPSSPSPDEPSPSDPGDTTGGGTNTGGGSGGGTGGSTGGSSGGNTGGGDTGGSGGNNGGGGLLGGLLTEGLLGGGNAK
jgi:hypothetical protein